MTSFQDAPDENIEHDEKMELRSTSTNFLKRLFLDFVYIFPCEYDSLER